MLKQLKKAFHSIKKVSQQPPKVLVVGSSGYVGKATLHALKSRHGSKVEIFAGARDPSKFDPIEGIKVVQADMGDKVGLTKTLRGFDHVFLVVPGHEKRTELTLKALEAAKNAGIKFVLVLSVLTAGTNSIFGKQFEAIEDRTKQIGIKHTIIRLPIFIDNNYANVQSIKDQGTFYDPRDPSALHTPVAVSDVGKAASDILARPDKHIGKTYKLVSPAYTLRDMAAAFTKALEKQIKPTTVSYDACKEAFLGMGFPEWQTDGIIELFKYMNEGSSITNETDTGDIEKITGERATSIVDWVEQNAVAFK